MMLIRLMGLTVTVVGLTGCGAVQLATSSGDEQETHAMMMSMAPPLLIVGDWSANRTDPMSTADYAALIRTRNDGRMTTDRSHKILFAMDQIFGFVSVKNMSEAQLDNFLGPADKKLVRSGHTAYLYRFNSPEGTQERWLVTS